MVCPYASCTDCRIWHSNGTLSLSDLVGGGGGGVCSSWKIPHRLACFPASSSAIFLVH